MSDLRAAVEAWLAAVDEARRFVDHDGSLEVQRSRAEQAVRRAVAATPAESAHHCHPPDTYFDRSLCPVDDWMHTRCRECGTPLDGDCAATPAESAVTHA